MKIVTDRNRSIPVRVQTEPVDSKVKEVYDHRINLAWKYNSGTQATKQNVRTLIQSKRESLPRGYDTRKGESPGNII